MNVVNMMNTVNIKNEKNSESGARIAVLTLNPAVDRLISLDNPFARGGLNRAVGVTVSAGGKGLNQCAMLKKLGCDPLYFSVTGESGADECSAFAKRLGIESFLVKAPGGVRTNIKITDSDGVCTEINEAGGPVYEDTADRLCDMIIESHPDIVSICGSIPAPLSSAVYRDIIVRLKTAGIPAILDCDKAALELGISAAPYLIKPNRFELAWLSGTGADDVKTREGAVSLCRNLYERTGVNIICTLDEDGSLYCGEDGIYAIPTVRTTAKGFAGAGDAYLAAFVSEHVCRGAGIESALCFAAAASCAKVELSGTEMPERDIIEKKLIQIRELGGAAPIV